MVLVENSFVKLWWYYYPDLQSNREIRSFFNRQKMDLKLVVNLSDQGKTFVFLEQVKNIFQNNRKEVLVEQAFQIPAVENVITNILEKNCHFQLQRRSSASPLFISVSLPWLQNLAQFSRQRRLPVALVLQYLVDSLYIYCTLSQPKVRPRQRESGFYRVSEPY